MVEKKICFGEQTWAIETSDLEVGVFSLTNKQPPSNRAGSSTQTAVC